MTAVPNAISLISINTGAPLLSADHRTNYGEIQSAVNGLISCLEGGAAGQGLAAIDGTDVQWANAGGEPQAAAAGLINWNFNPMICSGNSAFAVGTVNLMGIYIPPGKTVTGIALGQGSTGTYVGAAFYVGLAKPDGTMLAQSSNQAPITAVPGYYQFPFTATYNSNTSDSATGFYYTVALMGSNTGSQPGWFRTTPGSYAGSPIISSHPGMAAQGATLNQATLPANGSGQVGGITSAVNTVSYFVGVY